MAEPKILEKGKRITKKLFNGQLVFTNFLALSFFVIANAFFTPLLGWSDLYKLFLIIYGFFVILLSVLLVYEYLHKTILLQANLKTSSYSTILSINTFFGLIMPFLYINILMATIIRAMEFMTNFGTLLCTIRLYIVHFYYYHYIEHNVNNIITILIILNAILFLFGGLLERLVQQSKANS